MIPEDSLSQKRVPKVAITSGDPQALAPKSSSGPEGPGEPSFTPVIIGSAGLYSSRFGDFMDSCSLCAPGDDFQGGAGRRLFVDIPFTGPAPVPGQGSAETGRQSLKYIDTALDLWLRGDVDALVTGPVSKALIERSGTPFTGHTEYIAARTGGDPFMMMYSDYYRVILVTTHIPVASIAGAITEERICQVIRAGHESMKAIDGGTVKLAIAGCDPHCGDEGAIGTFDRDVTAAAVGRARMEGIDIEGPFAADTLFLAERWKRYNLIIAQYHDQGLIPFKQLAFDRGVNVTLGLPLVRTSVDHGTAFDIAGTGKAAAGSMIEALAVACRLEGSRPGRRP